MPTPWYSRVANWFTRYNDTFDEKTPVLFVATPLANSSVSPVKPLTIVVPLGHVTGDVHVPVRKPRKKTVAKRKMKARKR